MRILSLLLLIMPLLLGAQSVTTLTSAFNGSGGLTRGPDGRIYIADFGYSLNQADGNVVWRFNHSEGLVLFASGLSGASGNDFNAEGNLIQSNIANSVISSISPNGDVSFLTNRFVNGPVGVLVRDNGDIIICNCNGNNMLKYSASGQMSVFASGQGLFCPNGITEADDGFMYISNFSNGKVLKMDDSGRITELVALPGGNNGHLTFANGVLYVCSHGSSRIYEVQLNGSYRVLAGSGIRGNLDGEATKAQFSRPNGIAASKTGDTLYVNSSIPVTDAGGRPLNPSLLRMISGVHDFTLSAHEGSRDDYLLVISDNGEEVILEYGSNSGDELEIRFIDIQGRTLLQQNATKQGGSGKISIRRPNYSGVLFMNVRSVKNDRIHTFKLCHI